MATAKKTVKKPVSKAAKVPAKKSTVKVKKAPAFKTFQLTKESRPFASFGIKEQRFYWFILFCLIITLTLWVFKIQMDTTTLINSIA